jgi:hypothetical protein
VYSTSYPIYIRVDEVHGYNTWDFCLSIAETHKIDEYITLDNSIAFLISVFSVASLVHGIWHSIFWPPQRSVRPRSILSSVYY